MTGLQGFFYAIAYAVTHAVLDAKEDHSHVADELVDPGDGSIVYRFRRIVRASKGDPVTKDRSQAVAGRPGDDLGATP